jgi:succinoglycan biosynthesis protein ExoA
MTSRGETRASWPRISTITPMLDEARHVDGLVADLAAQDYEGEVEVLVADGASTDGSVERLLAAADRAGLEVTILHNAAKWVAPGLNACVRRATGDPIIRLDCHTRYPADYLRKCVEALAETGAWCVGGVVVPVGETPVERALASAASSPFGGVGRTIRDVHAGRVDSDIAYCGAFRREAFDRVGLFDETLVRNQDDELSLRLVRGGGRIVLDPAIRSYYRPRGSYRGAWRQYSEYGFWKIAVMAKHRRVPTARSVVPLAFVVSLISLASASVVSPVARRALGMELVMYGGCAVAFGAATLDTANGGWRQLPRIVAGFPTFHVAYGAGMLRGILVAAREGRAGFRARAERGAAM